MDNRGRWEALVDKEQLEHPVAEEIQGLLDQQDLPVNEV